MQPKVTYNHPTKSSTYFQSILTNHTVRVFFTRHLIGHSPTCMEYSKFLVSGWNNPPPMPHSSPHHSRPWTVFKETVQSLPSRTQLLGEKCSGAHMLQRFSCCSSVLEHMSDTVMASCCQRVEFSF